MSKSRQDKSKLLPDPKITASAADDDRIGFEQRPVEDELKRMPARSLAGGAV